MNTGQLQVCESQAGAIWSAPARKDAGLEVIEQALEYVRNKPQVEVNDMDYQIAAG